MKTMNISLSDTLKPFVGEQIAQGSYGTSGKHVHKFIHKDQNLLQLRSLLLAGATSAPAAAPADSAYFKSLRDRVRKAANI